MGKYIEKASLLAELKRLTGLAYDRYLDTPTVSPCSERYYAQYSERAALKDMVEHFPTAEESGGLVELPCRVGDTVYFRTYKAGTDIGIQPHEVTGIRVLIQTKGADIPIWEFGKDVFLSLEEAERNERSEV
ncbi:MAG: hypothetical protein HFE78_07390 [Clostridiales bacterium]|nr:hypothetical protein [Clostridiales bacterium]